ELLPEIQRRLPRSFGTYWEPFVGGGALFFAQVPAYAVLADLNEELVNCYDVVKTNVEALITSLREHRNTRSHFLHVRKMQPWHLDSVERAARLIFLNKTCFNGLYRVNQRGEFNVPFGNYINPNFCDERTLRAASKVLQTTEILCRDFRVLLYRAQPTDFIYFDPPYYPVSSTSSFTSYSESPFGEREQRSLRAVFRALADRGCHVMLSNSDTPLIRKLYKGFRMEQVLASRAINCKGNKRGKISELIIRNYE
ncbi:MAG: DNA adenine methylase, partial [Candidatus Acidiferrales bacterium]